MRNWNSYMVRPRSLLISPKLPAQHLSGWPGSLPARLQILKCGHEAMLWDRLPCHKQVEGLLRAVADIVRPLRSIGKPSIPGQ